MPESQAQSHSPACFGFGSPGEHFDDSGVRSRGWCGLIGNNRGRERLLRVLHLSPQPQPAPENSRHRRWEDPVFNAARCQIATRAKATWARLIRKVYEADPLVCPKYKSPMRVIALIDDPTVVRRILEHLGRRVPEPAERGPLEAATDWPRNVVIPIIYHPVPDIA